MNDGVDATNQYQINFRNAIFISGTIAIITSGIEGRLTVWFRIDAVTDIESGAQLVNSAIVAPGCSIGGCGRITLR